MPRTPNSFKEQRGYFTFVQNSETSDYLSMAYLQALSLKTTQKINSYAIAIDSRTKKLITDKHKKLFDYIIDAPYTEHAMNKEWMTYELTPFKETIKLDADILFNRNIDHWWSMYRNKDISITTKIRDYTGAVSNIRNYRRVFDTNKLINAYSGLSYFRYTQTMADFFKIAKEIIDNWDSIRLDLINEKFDNPQTDEVYAIAAKIIGEEKCTQDSYQSFVHLKPEINYRGVFLPWNDVLMWNLTQDFNMQIGGYMQHYPIHYINKNWPAKISLEKHYERYYRKCFLDSSRSV